MARQVAAVPSTWRERGVRYVPDIDTNRSDPDPFWVLLRPLTANESASIHSAEAARHLKVRFDGANGATIDRAAEAAEWVAATEAAMRKAISVAVIEVHGYSGRNVETGEVITPRNGAELVAFVEGHAWDSEREVMQDLYRAVTERSHLERALGEASAPRSGISSAEIQASNGPAPDAAAPSTDTMRTDPPSTSYVAPEGVMVRLTTE
jgi:hypothetical protein